MQNLHTSASPHEVLVGNGHNLAVFSIDQLELSPKACLELLFYWTTYSMFLALLEIFYLFLSLPKITKHILNFMLTSALSNHRHLTCSCLKVSLMKMDCTASTTSLLKPHITSLFIVLKLCILLLIKLMLVLDKMVQSCLSIIIVYGMLD